MTPPEEPMTAAELQQRMKDFQLRFDDSWLEPILDRLLGLIERSGDDDKKDEADTKV